MFYIQNIADILHIVIFMTVFHYICLYFNSVNYKWIMHFKKGFIFKILRTCPLYTSLFISKCICMRKTFYYWYQRNNRGSRNNRGTFILILSRAFCISRETRFRDNVFSKMTDWNKYNKCGIVRSSKRGLDLGLSRGFSGSQAAKHLMGLAAANYAGGPGRRRRSEQA